MARLINNAIDDDLGQIVPLGSSVKLVRVLGKEVDERFIAQLSFYFELLSSIPRKGKKKREELLERMLALTYDELERSNVSFNGAASTLAEMRKTYEAPGGVRLQGNYHRLVWRLAEVDPDGLADILAQVGPEAGSKYGVALRRASDSEVDQMAEALLVRYRSSHPAVAPGGVEASSLVAAATSTETLAPGQFGVVVVGTLMDGSMNVQMQCALGADTTNVLHLAVMCFDEGGKDVLQGQDKDEKWWKLDDVKRPAILYVPRETLPYLQKQPYLWQRVRHCNQG